MCYGTSTNQIIWPLLSWSCWENEGPEGGVEIETKPGFVKTGMVDKLEHVVKSKMKHIALQK